MEAGDKPRLASKFAELGICEDLVEACDLMGWNWKEPARIQAEGRPAIPHALQGTFTHHPFHPVVLHHTRLTPLAWLCQPDNCVCRLLIRSSLFSPNLQDLLEKD